ncbi:unnamed protein product, partial [Scytosiphon promiscuus]
RVDDALWTSNHLVHNRQNIPVTAVSGSVRSAEFVREEWDQV